MRTSRALLFAIVGLITPAFVHADVKLPAIFGDNMVLQRNSQLPIWGTADPGEEVYVTFEQKTPDGRREKARRSSPARTGGGS